MKMTSGLKTLVRALPTAALAMTACLALTACEAWVHVDGTANVSARYSRVLVTVKEIWFNTSATAIPTDEGWEKFTFKKGKALDLVGLNSGEIQRIASELKVAEGTYLQVRVILASRDDKLLDSADDADAKYNNEVTWYDEDGDSHRVPLEVLNADQGIGLKVKLKVKEATLEQAAKVQLLFDAARDLTEFEYSGETGFLLNPTLAAIDVDDVGTLRGSMNLGQIAIDTGTGRPEIEVTAQKLDKTLNRHVIVGSAAVSRLGTFVMYPLPLDDGKDTEYDLVIHGPRMQTIVIKDVPVSEGTPGNAAQLSLAGLRAEAAESFEANIREAEPVFPRGARIGFYQTLPGDDKPYLIDVATVDPLQGRFAQPVALTRASSISWGTYGNNFTLRSGTPEEGASRYGVAALSAHYGAGALAGSTLRPASQASDTASFSVPAIALPADATAGTIAVNATFDTPGRYDRGVLVVSHEGAVVTVASLDEVLQQQQVTAALDITQVPAGTSSATLEGGLYHLEAWTWKASDAERTFTRHRGAAAIDLRNATTASAAVTVP